MKKVIVTVPFSKNQQSELCSTGNELDFRFMNAVEVTDRELETAAAVIGNVIDNKALMDKEVYERFGGIWLDVCETEPLPDNDPLYHIPGLLLTPHITGGFHLQKTVDNIFDICMNNLKAWCGEGSYKHVVDREAGYSLG